MTELKTATFACIHFAVAFSVGWMVTGSPVIGGVLAVIEPLVNTVAFYLHERVWQRVCINREAAAARHGPVCTAIA
ncbi:MAG: DUF2061 domain-containing protein [Haliea sp.]|nr:DUF2061 domain-containing protein [Haliea sp.]